jgi:hypothetical protein
MLSQSNQSHGWRLVSLITVKLANAPMHCKTVDIFPYETSVYFECFSGSHWLAIIPLLVWATSKTKQEPDNDTNLWQNWPLSSAKRITVGIRRYLVKRDESKPIRLLESQTVAVHKARKSAERDRQTNKAFSSSHVEHCNIIILRWKDTSCLVE